MPRYAMRTTRTRLMEGGEGCRTKGDAGVIGNNEMEWNE